MSKAPRSGPHDPHPIDPAERRRVFTIHVRSPADATLGGRVIHAASGAASHFESPDELARFVRRVLSTHD